MIDKQDHCVPDLPHVVISCARDLAQVMAVVASLRVDCAVLSPPGAGCFMGVPWWAALTAGCPLPSMLDCGQAAGHAAAALRAGMKHVIVSATPAQQHALASLAQATGGHVLSRRPVALDLPARNACDTLERYLCARNLT
ncbi:hypothetical protein CD178_00811 [Komagataeibacter saccharivorans]|uniref:Uncharacterized protein n=1 Tax=Komagataeibacter saccharivorans TaxID=265959 RepID=A0A347W9S1_9PROT|nr:hypothetical protein CD178_00811 [Komagataeibacter saccharivorans]